MDYAQSNVNQALDIYFMSGIPFTVLRGVKQ